MKIRKVFIWSLIRNEHRPSFTEIYKQNFFMIAVLGVLFPGINYYVPSDFDKIVQMYATPVLKKLFPEVEKLKHNEFSKSDILEIKPFLKSRGYEWRDNKNWEEKFNKLLET